MLVSVQDVRRWAAFAAASTWETGDGRGTENTVRCRGANWLVLFVQTQDAGVDYQFMVEFHAGGDQPYRDTASAGGATDSRIKLVLAAKASNALGTKFAIVTPIRGRLARVSAQSATQGKFCSVTAATASTLGGEGRGAGPFLVKTAGALKGTGDGAGAENPVPIRMGSRITLLLSPDLGDNSRLDLYMETSLDSLDFYRETTQSGTNPVDLLLRTYQVSQSTIGESTPSLTLSIYALGAWARFNFSQGVATVNGAACQAIVGSQ